MPFYGHFETLLIRKNVSILPIPFLKEGQIKMTLRKKMRRILDPIAVKNAVDDLNSVLDAPEKIEVNFIWLKHRLIAFFKFPDVFDSSPEGFQTTLQAVNFLGKYAKKYGLKHFKKIVEAADPEHIKSFSTRMEDY